MPASTNSKSPSKGGVMEEKMITAEGKRICDKEIRNRKGQWVGCRAPAHSRTPSKNFPHMELDFCGRHAPEHSTAEQSA